MNRPSLLKAPAATKRPDGRYHSRRMVHGQRVIGYGTTARTAEADFLAKARRYERDLPLTDSRMLLVVYINKIFTSAIAASGLAARTVELYRDLLRRHVEPMLGRAPIGAIRPSDVERVLVTMQRGGLSGSTRRSTYAALRKVLDYAVRDGLIAANPVVSVRRPVAEHREARFLDQSQVAALLNVIDEDPLRALWLLALATGCRRGELLGLAWDDLDLDEGMVHVRRQVIRTREGLVETAPKGRRTRDLHLPASMTAVLRRHRREQIEWRLARPADHRGDRCHDHLFVSEVGTVLDPRNVNRRFAEVVKVAGVDASPHSLRHTVASMLLTEGRPVHEVAVQMGHSSPVITLQTYAHVMPSAGRKAAAVLDKMISG